MDGTAGSRGRTIGEMEQFSTSASRVPDWRRWWPLVLGAGAAAAVAVIGTGDLLRTIWPLIALRDAALVAVLAVAACGLGAIVAELLHVAWPGAKGVLLRASLGLAVASVLVFAVGSAGALNRPVLAALLVAGLAAAAWAPRVAQQPSEDRAGEGRQAERALDVAIGIAALVALRGALAPETFYDALHYHDALPALFLRHGRVEVFPFAIHSAMPLGIHMLFAPLLAWGGASTVKLAHFSFYLGSAAWIGLLARSLGGRIAGRIAALLFMSIPGVAVMAGLGGVDLGITFFSVGGLALVVKAMRETRWHGYVAGSACLVGAAVGGKYSALAVGGVWGIGVLFRVLRSRDGVPGERIRTALVAAILVTVVGGGWYARNWITLGTPIFPELSPPGSEGAWSATVIAAETGAAASLTSLPTHLIGLLLGRDGRGAGSETWPLAPLAILPGLLWGAWRGGLARLTAAAVLVLLIIWAGSVPILRYGYPALALAAAVSGAAWRDAARRFGWLVAAVLVLGAGGGWIRALQIQEALTGGLSKYHGTVETAEEYLATRTPEVAAARWLRSHTPESGTKLLLIGETRGYYLNRDYEPVSAYSRHPLVGWAGQVTSGEELVRLLRRQGLTHVLVNRGEFERLNQKYGNCMLTAREAEIVGTALAKSKRVFTENGVAIYELPES